MAGGSPEKFSGTCGFPGLTGITMKISKKTKLALLFWSTLIILGLWLKISCSADVFTLAPAFIPVSLDNVVNLYWKTYQCICLCVNHLLDTLILKCGDTWSYIGKGLCTPIIIHSGYTTLSFPPFLDTPNWALNLADMDSLQEASPETRTRPPVSWEMLISTQLWTHASSHSKGF